MDTSHIPMMGFQFSYKSLKYGFSEGNSRVVPRDDLAAVLESVAGDVFTTVHYYTKEPERLVPELEAVMRLGSIYHRGLVEGVQINRVWPTTHQMAELRSKFPQLKIILQISSFVTGEMSDEEVARKLAKGYGDVAYVILDSSHGKGVEFDVSSITSTYKTFKANGVPSKVVFAGGFNGENVKSKLLDLRDEVGAEDFCIDAEGGLRDKLGEGYGNDVFNPDKARAYLRGAASVLLEGKRP